MLASIRRESSPWERKGGSVGGGAARFSTSRESCRGGATNPETPSASFRPRPRVLLDRLLPEKRLSKREEEEKEVDAAAG